MLRFTKKEEVKMFVMSIGNASVKMPEADMQKVIDYILELGYEFTEAEKKTQPKAESKVSQPTKELKSADKESAEKAIKKHNDDLKYVGTQVYADRDVTVCKGSDGIYRLYTHITKASSGKKEDTDWKRDCIKKQFKAYGFKYSFGSFEEGRPFWTLDDQAMYKKYVEDRQAEKKAYKESKKA